MIYTSYLINIYPYLRAVPIQAVKLLTTAVTNLLF